MSTYQPTPTNYAEALAILESGRTKASREARKIANNTWLGFLPSQEGEPRRIGVQLHATVVVTFHESGATSLDSGGYQTVTTKERINRYLAPGLSLYQEKHVWYVVDRRPEFLPGGVNNPEPWSKANRVEYSDGLLILPDASLHGREREAQEVQG